MKFLVTALALIATTSMCSGASATTPPSKEVVMGLSEVFVPGGFSSSTDAYVVVSGMFPNSCYSWKSPQITNPTPLVHEVKAMADVAQMMCLMVMIPFQKEIRLGKLVSGAHTLRFVNGDGTFFEKTLTIE
ncbi:MAG: hypothetical protein ACXVA9_05835 [Bdellovibrionales bacterium]